MTENNQKKEEKTQRKRKNKESALCPIPTHKDSRKVQELKPKEEDTNREEKNEREQGKRKRVLRHACVHLDDRSSVVIASSWQMARITHLDARHPTPPQPPPLPCMVCVVCRVVYVYTGHGFYSVCRVILQRERISIQSVVSV